MMSRKAMTFISAGVVISMAVVAAYLAMRVPSATLLPIHWNYRGQADSFSNAWIALFLPVAITALLSLVFYGVPTMEPRAKNLERSQGLYFSLWTSVLLMGLFYEMAVVSVTLRLPIQAPDLILFGVGMLFVLVGNQLGKSRSMNRIGLRTPWTLASEEVWMRTHRLSGKLMVAGGLLVAFSAALEVTLAITLVMLLVSALSTILLPAMLSFVFWRAEQRVV